ncbi:MAG: malate synthase A, partial [Sphingomicrobium sp.]
MSVIDQLRALASPSRVARADEVLTDEALDLVAELHLRFDSRRKALLGARNDRQKRFDAGELPDFRADTAAIREGDWRILAIPADLLDRRVEITGPTNAKMVINALNSGAKVFMADFEDATAPRWDELVQGQLKLKDRWAGRLAFTDPASGKAYAIGLNPAVLIVRPRGLHLEERHVIVDGEPVAGAWFDAALYLVHNAKASLAAGSGPYFYLPKLESMEEAALWSDVLSLCEDRLCLDRGTVKVTVLIETLPAAFEMDEILHEL